jgi:hypothetical protein
LRGQCSPHVFDVAGNPDRQDAQRRENDRHDQEAPTQSRTPNEDRYHGDQPDMRFDHREQRAGIHGLGSSVLQAVRREHQTEKQNRGQLSIGNHDTDPSPITLKL